MKRNLVATTTFVVLCLITLATPALSNPVGFNLIFAINGNVQIKRPRWTRYKKIYAGTLVNSSDKLRLTRGASAKVFCSNLSIWTLPSPGVSSISRGCPSGSRAVLRRPNSNTSFTRAGNNPNIPYSITPRNSKILTSSPHLRWNAIAGVTKYQVRLSGPGVDWKTEVSEPQVVYSGKEPLKPGYRYWFTVTADNGATTENQNKPGFTLMSEAEISRVKAEIVKLQQQGLKDEDETIALAHLYRSNELYSDAIDLLSGFIQKDNASAIVYQLLGSTYQQVGLDLLAREKYLTALKLAETEKNLEAQATIQESLGEVDFSLDNLQDALQWYQAAQVSYLRLSDIRKTLKLQNNVNKIKARI